MKIFIANPHGFCFGVKRAIKITQKCDPCHTYIFGDIVHNDHVVRSLKIKTVYDLNKIPSNSSFIIRAHGAAPYVYQEAKKRNLKIIDATCPLVLQIHQFVKKNSDKDIIYLVSSKNHDEVIGVVAQGNNITPYTLGEYKKIKVKTNSLLITQTTLSVNETQKAIDYLKQKFPQLTIFPHICPATTERQLAVCNLSKKVDCMVIIGSPKSSNSLRLYETALSTGKSAIIVDSLKELKLHNLKKYNIIGLSSGASTPEEILNEVYDYLSQIN
jgi:4-hydroxy-3-methylbut-2-enyl diphosphate reductase